MKITRTELNEEITKYIKNGGKITRLPDGPNFRFQAYGVRVPNSISVDTTVGQDPVNKKQLSYYEKSAI
tara:strand:+ start:133 stop:339 length:207 start_codon:yes stop_codon:yes gene_type:complete